MQAEVLDSMRVKMRSTEDGSSAVIFVATPKHPTPDHEDTNKPVAILELFVGNDESMIDIIEEVAAEGESPEKYAWLASIAVSKHFRRQGCAKVLLDAVHEKLYELECEWAILSVYPGNHAAVALYESAGYMKCGMQGNSFLDFLGSKSRVMMARPRDDVKGRIARRCRNRTA
jgi:ribosomal protein S18 acetylase RimI-like enzyme